MRMSFMIVSFRRIQTVFNEYQLTSDVNAPYLVWKKKLGSSWGWDKKLNKEEKKVQRGYVERIQVRIGIMCY